MEALQRKTHSIEMVLARLLRVCSLAAAALLTVGVVMTLLGMAAGATLTTAGLVALVSTPVLRVAVAGLIFLKERDLLFAAFCAAVLLSLIGGMLIGQVE